MIIDLKRSVDRLSPVLHASIDDLVLDDVNCITVTIVITTITNIHYLGEHLTTTITPNIADFIIVTIFIIIPPLSSDLYDDDNCQHCRFSHYDHHEG